MIVFIKRLVIVNTGQHHCLSGSEVKVVLDEGDQLNNQVRD